MTNQANGRLPGYIIDNTTIAVDYFAVKNNVTHYFLTHGHSDHTRSLDHRWSKSKIYCSEITKKYIINERQVNKNYINALELDIEYVMKFPNGEKFSVTLIDANHCPGAVMFYFQGKFGNVLCTGDFRYTPSMLNNSCLIDEVIDLCYIDNTFLHPSYSNIPSRANAFNEMADLIDIKLEMHPNAVFEIEMNKLGKEDILVDLYDTFDWPVHVSKQRFYHLTEALDFDEECFSTSRDPRQMLFFVKEDFDFISIHGKKIITINPTALGFDQNERKNYEQITEAFMRRDISYYEIPYSDHSSYGELVAFAKNLNPKQFKLTVKYDEVFDPSRLDKYLRKEKRVFSCRNCCGLWFDWININQSNSVCSKCQIYCRPLPDLYSVKKLTSKNHSCSKCQGRGRCPVYDNFLF